MYPSGAEEIMTGYREILEAMDKLNKEFGITILYITHDLTTAYHVSDYILILYKGSIMEAGDIESIIRNPQHPYTQLLIGSIPWPDLDRVWGEDIAVIDIEEDTSEESRVGCKFAGRCPHVMDKCKVAPPPLYWPDDNNRVASCYLFDDKPVLPGEDVGTLFRSKKVAAPR